VIYRLDTGPSSITTTFSSSNIYPDKVHFNDSHCQPPSHLEPTIQNTTQALQKIRLLVTPIDCPTPTTIYVGRKNYQSIIRQPRPINASSIVKYCGIPDYLQSHKDAPIWRNTEVYSAGFPFPGNGNAQLVQEQALKPKNGLVFTGFSFDGETTYESDNDPDQDVIFLKEVIRDIRKPVTSNPNPRLLSRRYQTTATIPFTPAQKFKPNRTENIHPKLFQKLFCWDLKFCEPLYEASPGLELGPRIIELAKTFQSSLSKTITLQVFAEVINGSGHAIWPGSFQ